MDVSKYKWTIFVADLSPVKGSEQRGNRPVLVISDENFNQVMPVVTILPINNAIRIHLNL